MTTSHFFCHASLKITVLWLFFTFYHSVPILAQKSVAEAQSSAVSVQDSLPVLLVFSGSDWCMPCIQLEKTILSDSSFIQFAGKKLNIVRADFPQRKKIPDTEKRASEALADRYNPEGTFPKVLLLNPDRTILSILAWKGHSPGSFEAQIESHLNSK